PRRATGGAAQDRRLQSPRRADGLGAYAGICSCRSRTTRQRRQARHFTTGRPERRNSLLRGSTMPQYFCSLPNEKKAGRIPFLISDDPEKIAAFIKRWDIPGRGVFYCINPLRPSATARTIENVAAIERLVVDIDFKDLAATPEEIEQRLRSLPLQPTSIR